MSDNMDYPFEGEDDFEKEDAINATSYRKRNLEVLCLEELIIELKRRAKEFGSVVHLTFSDAGNDNLK